MKKVNRLGLNIDHIAFIKKSRGTAYPSLIKSVQIAQEAGVDLITIHLREDRRHIQDQDVIDIRKNTKILNLEMAHTDEMINIALKAKPNFCCIVPEKREEITTEGGLNLLNLKKINQLNKLKNTISDFNDNDIKTSIFIDPDPKQINIAKEVNANFIELHTGHYANHSKIDSNPHLENLKKALELGLKKGLVVNAGHGLNYENIKPICKLGFHELNIGHAIIAKSVFVGLKDAIREMISIIKSCD